jgi:LPS sulfotransferase NodH
MYEEGRTSGADPALDPLAHSQPVILLGRGGSGTRLLAELALSIGTFLGNELNASHDSVEWVETLYDLAVEIVTAGGANGSERDLYWRKRLRRRASEILASGRCDPTALWGWKLPETMLTLPQALRAFPRARVVHLVRHPVTSALRRTHMTSRLDNPVGRVVLPAAYRACGLDPENIERDEPYIHNAVTWAYQVRGVLDTLRSLSPTEGWLQFRYEEICANPVEAQKSLAAFLGTAAPMTGSPEIDVSRTGDFRPDDSKMGKIWSICGGLAFELGYEL